MSFLGLMKNVNGDPCSTEANGMPSDDCIFIVDGPSSLSSSVMSVPYFPGTDHWSDKSEDGIYQCDLPTKHNTMCNGQSVSDVVRQSPDFAGYQPDITEELDTTPKFTILQPGSLSGSFVFVLDYSGSMFGNTERSTFTLFIEHTLAHASSSEEERVPREYIRDRANPVEMYRSGLKTYNTFGFSRESLRVSSIHS